MKRINRNQKPEGLVKWEGDELYWMDTVEVRGYEVKVVGYSPSDQAVYYRKTEESSVDVQGDNEYYNPHMKEWDMTNPDGSGDVIMVEQYWDSDEDSTMRLVNNVVKKAFQVSGLDPVVVEDRVSAMLLWFEGEIWGKARVSPIESGEVV
jgi:hypothetical protein